MATKKTGKGPAPAALEPKVVKKLLDLLSTDNEFRRLFKKDAHAALIKAGFKPTVQAGAKTGLAATTAATSGGACLQLQTTDKIATKECIVRDRAKLEQALVKPFSFVCPLDLKA